MSKLIAYLRVSTQRQGASGLGLDAQRAAVEGYARMAGHEVVETYVEVESGKRSDRPELARALAKCKLVCATLVVAKLDRLARDLAFVACLMRDKIPFVACDNPHATELTIGILAAIAQHEAKMISDRTKAALAAAKARGVTLGGNHTFTAAERAKGRAIGSTTIAAKFNHRAEAVAPIIKELRQSGATTLQQLADGLNQRGVRTARGGSWHAAQVARIVEVACR